MSSAVAPSSSVLGVGRLHFAQLLQLLITLWLVFSTNGEGTTYSCCRVEIQGTSKVSAIQSNPEAAIRALVVCGGETLHDATTATAEIRPIPIDGTPLSLFAEVGENLRAILSVDGPDVEEPFELTDSSFTDLPTLEGTTLAPLVISRSNVKVDNATFNGNRGFDSGGVYLQKSASAGAGMKGNAEVFVEISGTEFSSNQGNKAGAIAIGDYPALRVIDCHFLSNDNSAISSIGTETVNLVVVGSTFEGAEEGSKASFTSVSGIGPGSVSIKGSSFFRNDNSRGGALRWENQANDEIVELDLEACHFEENLSDESGGALYIGKYVALTVKDSTFKENNAKLTGGAIELTGRESAKISGTTFQENICAFDGGAIHSQEVQGSANGLGCTLILEGVDFIENESTGGSGGAVWMESGNTTMTGGSMEGNKAFDKGGALSAEAAKSIRFTNVGFKGNSLSKDGDESGGAIHAKEIGEVFVDSCEFTENKAGEAACGGQLTDVGGGALFATGTPGTSIVFVRKSHFSKNVGNMGGALFLAELASASILDSSFEGNRADRAGSIKVENVGDFDLTGSTVKENEACGREGGAVFAGGQGSSFTISKSHFTGNSAPDHDGGVAKIENYESISVDQSTFKGNTAKGSGGAFHITGATGLNITKSDFSTNTGELGGSLFTSSVSKVKLSGSTFSKSTASTKGGAYYGGGTTESVSITGSSFTESEVQAGEGASEGGGGVALEGVPKVDISGTEFAGNSGNRGGGALLSSCSVVKFSGCKVHGNKAKAEGGGVWSTASTSFSATGTTFTSNSATAGVGGAVYVFGEKTASRNAFTNSRSFSLSDSRFEWNTADTGGGAFVSSFGTSSVTKSSFTSNTAKSKGGSLHVEDTASVSVGGSSSFSSSSATTSGGAVSISGSSVVSVAGSSFTSNKAETGGAVHVESVGTFTGSDLTVTGNTAGQQGGGFFSQQSRSFSFSDSVFEGNTARSGGGMWFDGSKGFGGGRFIAVGWEKDMWEWNAEGDMVIEMNSTNFKDNAATVDGGAVLVENVDKVVLSNSVLEGNTAKQGAGIYADTVDQMEVEDVTISDAVADENGGAVYLEDSNINATSVTLKDNEAKEDGGGLFCGKGTRVFVTDSKFVLNNAGDVGATVMADCGCVVDIEKSALEIEMEANGSKNDTRDNAFYNDPACTLTTAIKLRDCVETYVVLDSGIGTMAVLIIVVFGVLVVMLGLMIWMVIAARDPLARDRNLEEAQLMAVAAVGLPTTSEAPGKEAQAPLLS